MPRLASASNTPNDTNNHNSPRMSDVALRKKKNADAQAAFRARRANYISTLEETVTNLESVVLQLQDSCREARAEAQELRQDNARLRHAFRERENLWRAMWPRKSGHGPDTDDPPPPPPLSYPHPAINGHLGSSQLSHYGSDSMPYRPSEDPSMCGSQYPAPNPPALTYVENEVSPDGSQPLASRVAKYNSYFNPVTSSPRDGSWSQGMGQTSPGEQGLPPNTSHSSGSPHFAGSPTITSSEMSYVGRYPVEDQKAPLNTLETNPYVFPASRSISPSSSTPPSSSSATLNPPFQFNFPENGASSDRADFDYRRQGEVMLHGGTADISLAGPASDAVRYRLGTKRTHSGADRPLLPILPSSFCHRLRSRRGAPLPRNSRSPSPGGAQQLSGTLAVIKAQAFGALRRTRTRTKKPSDGAAKVAIDVLEARGLGMGVPTPSKRPRLSDDLDLDS
ncbi:uncharacterized protein EV420DRAFT_1637320 [Desarmillaria tabescens]|uniref:BZIP domain-containing protein n=1 Tax=Armillaria tabescens TaxID=1929756 RepID=A0AA39TSM6_ARMTA|nr:uncharacterized protein EV420DRAFT_1637320 [Desarmillaria tabescens]KAK0465163.1 hypothetical protein EV420DRAFT_1637320 [Desarmillaria tabescens]